MNECYDVQGIDAAAAMRDWEHVGGKTRGAVLWPRVRFTVGQVEVSEVVVPQMMMFRDSEGKYLASRYQLPIATDYAVTVHNVQGLDLKEVVYDMSGAFANRQVYTGVSRCPEVDKLHIVGGVASDCKMQHKDVLDFLAGQEWIRINNVHEEGAQWEGWRSEGSEASEGEADFNWFDDEDERR
jgi:hypothetical protein